LFVCIRLEDCHVDLLSDPEATLTLQVLQGKQEGPRGTVVPPPVALCCLPDIERHFSVGAMTSELRDRAQVPPRLLATGTITFERAEAKGAVRNRRSTSVHRYNVRSTVPVGGGPVCGEQLIKNRAHVPTD
jgi:hypothetical protein